MPPYTIPLVNPVLDDDDLKNAICAIKSGRISNKGEFIDEFEHEFSKYVGKKYGIATCTGTSALHLALTILGIGKGDKVIVPSLTFIATANAVRYTGAEPVFADSSQEYWCVEPRDIENKISDKVKAIIVVHLYGHPCDMDAILDVANRYNIHVIEDCAQAHGAEYKGQKTGSFGILSCYSFFGNKIITTGQGGMCLTNNEELAKNIRILRDHGMSPIKKYWHEVIGFNYGITNIQAAIGVSQLKKLNELITVKRKVASLYNSLIKEVPEITMPPEKLWAKNIYWLYCTLINNGSVERIARYMTEHGIENRPFFYPVHKLPPYNTNLKLPVCEALSKKGLCLPSSALLTEEKIEYIVDNLKHALNSST